MLIEYIDIVDKSLYNIQPIPPHFFRTDSSRLVDCFVSRLFVEIFLNMYFVEQLQIHYIYKCVHTSNEWIQPHPLLTGV
jgi:hypothetical protein